MTFALTVKNILHLTIVVTAINLPVYIAVNHLIIMITHLFISVLLAFDNITQKIKPLASDIESILESKFKKILENNIKKKLKKITLIKLNLKMIIKEKHLNKSQ